MRLGKAQMEYTRWLSKASQQSAAKKKKAQKEFNETQAELEKKREEINLAEQKGTVALAVAVNRFFR